MLPSLHSTGIDLLRAYYVLGVKDTVVTIVDLIPALVQLTVW